MCVYNMRVDISIILIKGVAVTVSDTIFIRFDVRLTT